VTFAGAGVSVQFTGALRVATNHANYGPGQTVFITATATYGGSPVANVLVGFRITKADGSLVTGSATTEKTWYCAIHP